MPLTRAGAAKARMVNQSPPSPSLTLSNLQSTDENMSLSVEGASLDGPKEHPLMNDLVLKTLLQFVKSSDLSSCRLVCKKWNFFTLPFVRSKNSSVTLYGVDHSKQRLRSQGFGYCELTKNRSINAFVQLISANTMGHPFSNFRLECFENTVNDKDRKLFLRLCGKDVRKITAMNCKVKDVTEILQNVPNLEYFTVPSLFADNKTGKVVKLFPENLKTKPKLTHLRTIDMDFGLKDTKKVCPTFFKELFEVAGNISTISMGYAKKEDILEVLNTIDTTAKMQCIENLTLPIVSPAHLELLKKMIVRRNGLKLKILSVREGYVFNAKNVWIQLVELCKNDLIELHSDYQSYRLDQTDATIEFPRMSRLKILELDLPDTICVQSNDFQKNFPVLEKLSLPSKVNIDELFTGGEGSTLKSLFIPGVLLKMRTFDRIIFLCQSLKAMKLCVEEDGIKIVKKLWAQMPQLEELNLRIKIKTKFNVDSLISGVSSRECQKIHKDENYWGPFIKMSEEVRAVKLLALGDKLRVDASITTLTKLRRFNLILSTDAQVDHISDISGYLAFYSMKCLKHIRINKCQLTKSCCQVLVTEMGLESWEFQKSTRCGHNIIPCKLYPYDDDEIGMDYCNYYE